MKLIPASDIKTYIEGGSTRVKTAYSVTGSHAKDNYLTVTGMSNLVGQNDADLMDVYVNGQLMTSGSTDATGDYAVSTVSAATLVFFFGLEDADIVTVIEASR